MVTYNHEEYIRQTVQSALDQKTTFPFEIVIGEDCSTDRTRDILLEMKLANPDKIRLLLREKNIGPQANQASTFDACRGQYIAMLEGDDCWTDPTKLQKQVDALESHPHWSMCFHTTRRVYVDGSKEPELYPAVWDREEATIDDLFESNFMNTCSIVFRNGLFGPLPSWHREITPGDWATSILNADRGPIGYVSGVMADYRIHSRGLWSQTKRANQLKEILRFLSIIDDHFRGKYRTQIDAYRVRMVEFLVAESDSLNKQYQSKTEEALSLHLQINHFRAPFEDVKRQLQDVKSELHDVKLQFQELKFYLQHSKPSFYGQRAELILNRLGIANKNAFSKASFESGITNEWETNVLSSSYELVRKIMRPIESAARRCRQSIGLSPRRSSARNQLLTVDSPSTSANSTVSSP
jgi:glycosyltransferase involved in cell wall biosynthesis